eukprot:9920250-Alexandrium_andersonii.AAC.1
MVVRRSGWHRAYLACRLEAERYRKRAVDATRRVVSSKRAAYKARLQEKSRGMAHMFAALRPSMSPPLSFVRDQQGQVRVATQAVDEAMHQAWGPIYRGSVAGVEAAS